MKTIGKYLAACTAALAVVGAFADEVAEESDLPIRRVLSALTVLEIDGYVRQCSARCFVRTVEIKE